MNQLNITGIVNNRADGDLLEEHGLSLSLEFRDQRYLLDTGAGPAFLPNLKKLGMNPADFDLLILSHGHYDHTGGLADFLRYNTKAPIFFGQDFTKKRFYYEQETGSRELFIPKVCLRAFEEIGSSRKKEITGFSEIAEDFYLTGPIPRHSFEDCGGPFFLDPCGSTPDTIQDEQSIVVHLSTKNILITGCCHSGLINTIDYCEEKGFPIQSVFGGFHLKSATEDRLRKTVDYLNQKNIEKIVPVHCTGENAIEYLKKYYKGIVADFRASNVIHY